MKILLKDINKNIHINDELFTHVCNTKLLHQVLNVYINNSKNGIKSLKNRALVSGSNKKLWAQKGTGKARVGSGKSPHFRSGGVAFLPRKKNVIKKVNKKMFHSVLKTILHDFFINNKIIFLKKLNIYSNKTKSLLNQIKFFTKDKKVVFLLDKKNNKLDLSIRNLKYISVNYFPNINILELINAETLIINEEVLSILNRVLLYAK